VVVFNCPPLAARAPGRICLRREPIGTNGPCLGRPGLPSNSCPTVGELQIPCCSARALTLNRPLPPTRRGTEMRAMPPLALTE